MDVEEFRRSLREDLEKNRRAFEGKYKAELDELLGLSREEIDRLVPGTTDLATYERLITVVKEASRANVEQAELKARVEELGDIAIRIARHVPSLAALL
ncbi:MAG: hypothetical protein GWO02_01490 [Gammaproteobacteria bacterium]|nr:hypothetical protein [Gammaproteobacteria bacterium]